MVVDEGVEFRRGHRRKRMDLHRVHRLVDVEGLYLCAHATFALTKCGNEGVVAVAFTEKWIAFAQVVVAFLAFAGEIEKVFVMGLRGESALGRQRTDPE